MMKRFKFVLELAQGDGVATRTETVISARDYPSARQMVESQYSSYKWVRVLNWSEV